MVNVEELDPEPFIEQLDKMGLPTDILHIKRGRAELKKEEQKSELNSIANK